MNKGIVLLYALILAVIPVFRRIMIDSSFIPYLGPFFFYFSPCFGKITSVVEEHPKLLLFGKPRSNYTVHIDFSRYTGVWTFFL